MSHASDKLPILGRSVYLESFAVQKPQLLAAAGQDVPVFLSLHISEEFSSDYCARAAELCGWLHAHGFRILADVSQKTVLQFGQPDLVALARELHLWALRIDYGFTVPEICTLAAQLPLVLNASVTAPADAARIAAAGPLVMAMHNFYPRPETGLDDDFFVQSTLALQHAGVRVLAFIPGDDLLRGPLREGLPTLERHRGVRPCAAYADMALHFAPDGIFVGDPGLSESERRRIERFAREDVLEIPARLAPEYESLYGRCFTCRPDSPAGLVRFQESREYSCVGSPAVPEPAQPRPCGTITMDNAYYGRYAGEIQLLRQDFAADARVNCIGRVDSRSLLLADCIRRGHRFCLVPEG